MMIEDQYADLINLPHHQSTVHPHMSAVERAAQFSSFAALSGYEDKIEETARYTDKKMELDEDIRLEIGRKLLVLSQKTLNSKPVRVLFFQKDPLKEGGYYKSILGGVSYIDFDNQFLKLEKEKPVSFDNLIDISFPDDSE